ncbi:MAG: hypothetical protein ACRDBY_05065 [Cetobacterium sp.]
MIYTIERILNCIIYFEDESIKPSVFTDVEWISYNGFKFTVNEGHMEHNVYENTIDKIVAETSKGWHIIFKDKIVGTKYEFVERDNELVDKVFEKLGIPVDTPISSELARIDKFFSEKTEDEIREIVRRNGGK